MVEVGSYKTPNEHGVYEDFDQYRQRATAEAQASARERGLEERLSALEARIAEVIEATKRSFANARKSTDVRFEEVAEALELSFADLRAEIAEQFAEARGQAFAVDERAELVKLGRQVRELRRAVEELRQEFEERG